MNLKHRNSRSLGERRDCVDRTCWRPPACRTTQRAFRPSSADEPRHPLADLTRTVFAGGKAGAKMDARTLIDRAPREKRALPARVHAPVHSAAQAHACRPQRAAAGQSALDTTTVEVSASTRPCTRPAAATAAARAVSAGATCGSARAKCESNLRRRGARGACGPAVVARAVRRAPRAATAGGRVRSRVRSGVARAATRARGEASARAAGAACDAPAMPWRARGVWREKRARRSRSHFWREKMKSRRQTTSPRGRDDTTAKTRTRASASASASARLRPRGAGRVPPKPTSLQVAFARTRACARLPTRATTGRTRRRACAWCPQASPFLFLRSCHRPQT